MNKKDIETTCNSSQLSSGWVTSPFRIGKGYLKYNEYIQRVLRGEKAMVMGEDYVVLSKNLYKKLLKMVREQVTE